MTNKTFSLILNLYFLSTINRRDLWRCSIHLLQSLLALPLHFANMPIKELVPGTDRNVPLTNFNHLRPRIVNLLVNALQVSLTKKNQFECEGM